MRSKIDSFLVWTDRRLRVSLPVEVDPQPNKALMDKYRPNTSGYG